jgi:hypothetical protein
MLVVNLYQVPYYSFEILYVLFFRKYCYALFELTLVLAVLSIEGTIPLHRGQNIRFSKALHIFQYTTML